MLVDGVAFRIISLRLDVNNLWKFEILSLTLALACGGCQSDFIYAFGLYVLSSSSLANIYFNLTSLLILLIAFLRESCLWVFVSRQNFKPSLTNNPIPRGGSFFVQRLWYDALIILLACSLSLNYPNTSFAFSNRFWSWSDKSKYGLQHPIIFYFYVVWNWCWLVLFSL